jgi:hypothetical protein
MIKKARKFFAFVFYCHEEAETKKIALFVISPLKVLVNRVCWRRQRGGGRRESLFSIFHAQKWKHAAPSQAKECFEEGVKSERHSTTK